MKIKNLIIGILALALLLPVGYTTASYIPNVTNWFQQIAEGNFVEYSFVEKFGENPDIDTGTIPQDVWGHGGLYTYSTTADIDKCSSSNAGDTQEITLTGQTLDNTEITQTITLNGQNKVDIPTDLFRLYRMWNSDSTDIAGTVYCYVDGAITGGVPNTDSDVRAVIVNGDNQTEMAIYTIPKGKEGYFYGGYVSSSRVGNNSAVFTWRMRFPDGVFRVQSRIAVIGGGNSSWNYKYPIPVGAIPAGTDIKLSVEDVDANNTGASGGFTILLKDI